MTIRELKQHLDTVPAITFRLPDGAVLPVHFHVTEIGLVTKHYIDCGGTERREAKASFQLWEAGDYDHRLAPGKFAHIINLAAPILGSDELEIEVEYQQQTIGKFGLDFNGADFLLVQTQTACLAQDACGIPSKPKRPLSELTVSSDSCCAPDGKCC